MAVTAAYIAHHFDKDNEDDTTAEKPDPLAEVRVRNDLQDLPVESRQIESPRTEHSPNSARIEGETRGIVVGTFHQTEE